MGKYKIVEKAYEINLDKIQEGFIYDSIICHSENPNRARYELFRKIRDEEFILRSSGEEVNYQTLPIKRCPSLDKVIFEGEVLTMSRVSRIIEVRERNKKLNKILRNKVVTHCYIVKNGSYYAPNSSGYVSRKKDAGVYDKDIAVQMAKSCFELYLEPINLSEHNQIIEEAINELKSRLLISI